MHLCLAKCDPHVCAGCGACGKTPGLCRECKVARQLLPPAPPRGGKRGLEALRREVIREPEAGYFEAWKGND